MEKISLIEPSFKSRVTLTRFNGFLTWDILRQANGVKYISTLTWNHNILMPKQLQQYFKPTLLFLFYHKALPVLSKSPYRKAKYPFRASQTILRSIPNSLFQASATILSYKKTPYSGLHGSQTYHFNSKTIILN